MKSVFTETDFEMEISFGYLVISFCWEKVTRNWKKYKSIKKIDWIFLRSKLVFAFIDQILLIKGNRKMKTEEDCQNILYDKFAHCVWKQTIIFMINLHLMFKSCIFTVTDFEDEISFHWNWFWGGNQFCWKPILKMEISFEYNWFWGGKYTKVISFCWQKLTTNWKLTKI